MHSTPSESPYEALGLPNGTPLREVDRRWKRMARDLHPDLHPPGERDALSARMAGINAARAAIHAQAQILSSPPRALRTQHGVFYTPTTPVVADLLEELRARDARAVRQRWFSRLFRGKRPERSATLTVLLCGAVVEEQGVASLVFESPLPHGRYAIVVPTLRAAGGHLLVDPQRPKSAIFDAPTTTSTTPFPPEEVAAMGLRGLTARFPSRTLDITRSARLQPPIGWSRAFYRR